MAIVISTRPAASKIFYDVPLSSYTVHLIYRLRDVWLHKLQPLTLHQERNNVLKATAMIGKMQATVLYVVNAMQQEESGHLPVIATITNIILSQVQPPYSDDTNYVIIKLP